MINATGARVVMARMTRGLIVPFTFAAMMLPMTQTLAQGTFPAPLPGQSGAPTSNTGPFFPNVEAPSVACMKEFVPLREEAEKRGQLVKTAGERRVRPDEACKLLGNFLQSEIKMIEYIEANAARCGIPPEIAYRIKTGHQNAEAMKIKVCKAAQEVQSRGPNLNGVFEPKQKEPLVGDFEMYLRH
jgi:hypothetical protein